MSEWFKVIVVVEIVHHSKLEIGQAAGKPINGIKHSSTQLLLLACDHLFQFSTFVALTIVKRDLHLSLTLITNREY